MKKLKAVLDAMTSMAIIAACIFLGVLVWKRYKATSFQVSPQKGMVLAAPENYSWNEHQSTLVIAIRKGCHFCEESMPFYKHLSELEQDHQLRAQLVFVAPDDRQSTQQVLSNAGVKSQIIAPEPLDKISVTLTPTLILLDQQGTVRQTWLGKQYPSGEADIVKAASR